MAIFNGALYLGGNFTEAGGNHFANYLAAYDGTNWFPVGGGSINGPVNALLTLGTNLYIGGSFTSVFGVQDNSGITRFDGSNFSPLNLGVNDAVFALGAIGSNLYVGGQFTGPVTASIASPNTSGILLWDGSSWSALGSGIPATPGSSYVSSIATIGTDVYVGGRFASAGGVSNTGNIARWDSSTGVTGSTWNSLGTSLNGDVNALLALSPSSLMVGGAFTNAGGNSTANYIAKWDPTNSSWSGLSGGLNNTVTAISSINNILYVGGKFTSAGGNSPANYLATFDGTSWSHVGNGPDGPSSAIAQFGGTIYIGGTFTAVQGARSPNFAAYGTSISGPGGVDQISATSDGKGNLYLAYTDESANVNFRGYNATTSSWSPSRLIANSPVLNSVAVSINAPVNDLIISYAKNGAVNFVRGKSPYSSVSDFTSEATLFSGATSDFVAGSEGVGSNGKFVEIFTSVTGQSYTVNSATITTVGSISGVVTLNGTPLSGVTIDGGALGTTTTDGGGAYLFSSIPYGTTFSLVPQKTGYVITPSPSAGSVTGSITSNFTATLASYSIGGIISIGGTPLAGALVDGGPLGTQITASDGSYSFTALYGTPYRFTPSLAGYSFTPPSVNSTVTGQSAVNFAGSPNRYPLSGVVMTTTGKPVPGVLVTSPQFPSTTTDTNGVFVFNNVTFGTSFQITVKRDGFNFTQSQQSGTVGVNTRLTFTADPQLFTISGKVITDAGAPLSGATINGGPLGTATSDASGQYSFTKVPFGVPYTIKAMIQGYSISPFAATGRVSGDANNNFIATAARVTLSGAVQLRGKPLAGVVVDGGSLGKQTTKADGKFSFPNLTPGTSFSLTPTLQGYSFAPSGVAGILTKDTSITFKISTKQAYGGAVIRASIASDGTESDGASSEALLSGDGTAAVFTSAASSLVDGDTNQHRDVFVRNISSATTTRISVSGNGDEGNDDSGVQVGSERSIAISNDGTLVAYSTNASNLVVDDLNSASDVLLYSALTNGQTLISSAAGGAQGDGASYGPSLSSSGSKVAFTSLATNLVSSDTNGVADVFVKTVSDGTIQRASTAADGSEANGASGFASLSGDGSIVAFSSTATNLVSSDTNGASDIFVKNLSSGSISRASVSSAGVEANGPSTLPVISGNGKFVAFQSTASNLVSGDSNGVADVFVKDLSTGAIERVSVTSSGEEANGASGTSIAISVDGRYVAFSSDATNLVPNDTDGVRDIFVHDRVTNRTGVISRAVNGAQATGASRNCWMSMDGQFYSFVSDAPNLISDDKNGVADVFVSVLPDLPQTFQAKSKIQNPPVLVVDSKNVTIVMQLFYIKGTPRSIEPLLNDKKSSKTTSITYSVTIKNTSVKNDIKKLTSKKNTLTLKNVDKGKYKVTYQAQTTQGSTVVSSTKASPTRTFSVVQ